MTYQVSSIPETQDIISFLSSQNFFTNKLVKDSLNNFLFYEFSIDDLKLPSPQELLTSVLNIKNLIGLKGWMSNGVESNSYKGFSLTYNPDFHDSNISIYHQTWGSPRLKQNFGRIRGIGDFDSIKNTYYDTYSFRKRHNIIENYLGTLFSQFYCPLLRSRAAFLKFHNFLNKEEGWHVDEPPTHLFRINIPLQTSEEHILEINGSDEYGNSLILTKHLEVGKAYIWNTRIPHRVTTTKFSKTERIHLVLGLGTWITYDLISDSFSKSQLYGIPLTTIIEQQLFLKNKIK